MQDVSKELWNRIDDLRGRMSMRELCEQLHLPEPSMQTTRVRGTVPKVSTLYSIARLLGTTMEYLYTGEREEWDDSIIFRKMASSQQLMDIAEALCRAEPHEIEMVGRMLGIQKGTSSAVAGASA